MADAPRPVIGLEIHVQLRTRTKLFCADEVRFDAPPNTRVCAVCLGLPGALPVLNREAVRLALRAALGLGMAVRPRSAFDRKSYFYPDLPKGYQITQRREPLATGGRLEVPGPDGAAGSVPLRGLHLEEDTGRSLRARAPGRTALNFNRAGVPLLEIVTEPALRDAAHARAFLLQLRRTLRYLDVSDCEMEHGSLRVDANLSLRGADGTLYPRTEVKNLNSFRGVESALGHEARRQAAALRRGDALHRETRGWDAARGATYPMRSKEHAADYRYLPEPDLPPLVLDAAWIAAERDALPEPPLARERRITREHRLSAEHAAQLAAERALADLFERTVAAGAPADQTASWLLGEVLALLNQHGDAPDRLGIAPAQLAELLALERAGEVTRAAARELLPVLRNSAEPPGALLDRLGLRRVDDRAQLQRWVDAALAAHPDELRRYRSGERRLLGFFMGEVMRASDGRADPVEVRRRFEREQETGNAEQ